MVNNSLITALLVGLLIVISSCARQARLYPIDENTAATGVLKGMFISSGTGNGEVEITLNDGEILKGEYSIVLVEVSHLATFIQVFMESADLHLLLVLVRHMQCREEVRVLLR